MEKLPSYIKKEKENIDEFQKDLPVLQQVVNGTWSKEIKLGELKTELAAVERKIQLSIEPVNQLEEPVKQAKNKKKYLKFLKILSARKASTYLWEYCK